MSYKNIGTPSGNNLYITIPLRGTKNWDQKLEDGFFIPVSQHDHTPGKGAQIVEQALDAAVRSKLDQVAVNTANIASNDTDIANLDSRVTQNEADIASNDGDIADLDSRVNSNDTDIANLDSRVTQNESDISSNNSDIATLNTRMAITEANIISNDTDIAAIDSRMTQAESDISSNGSLLTAHTIQIAQNDSDISNLGTRVTSLETNPIVELIIANQSDATAISNTTIQNKFVQVTGSGITLSSVDFMNCDISIQYDTTFSGCDINGCKLSSYSSASSGASFISSDTLSNSSSFIGFRGVTFEASSKDVHLRRIDIPTSYTTILFKNTLVATNAINIHDSNIEGYHVKAEGINVNFNYCKITPVDKIECVSSVDEEIRFTSCILDSQAITSGSFAIYINSDTNIFHPDTVLSSGIKINASSGNIVDKSLGAAGFKVIDLTVTDFDKGIKTSSTTPSDGDILVYNSTTQEWQPQTSSALSNVELIAARELTNVTWQQGGQYGIPIAGLSLDTYSKWNSSNTRFESLSNGNYVLTAYFYFDNLTATDRIIISKNGSTYYEKYASSDGEVLFSELFFPGLTSSDTLQFTYYSGTVQDGKIHLTFKKIS